MGRQGVPVAAAPIRTWHKRIEPEARKRVSAPPRGVRPKLKILRGVAGGRLTPAPRQREWTLREISDIKLGVGAKTLATLGTTR